MAAVFTRPVMEEPSQEEPPTQPASMKQDQELQHKVKRVQLQVHVSTIHCLFFGKRGTVIQLPLKAGHPSGSSYKLEAFEYRASDLMRELGAIKDTLGIKACGSTICRLPSGVYIHCYGKGTVCCSSVKLSDAKQFFVFDDSALLKLPSGRVNIMPVIFAGHDLAQLPPPLSSAVSATHYTWVSDPAIAWDWNEKTWSHRLVEVLMGIPECKTKTIKVIDAFKWTPTEYVAEICTLFPSVVDVSVSPFHGMTDILLLGEGRSCVVQLNDPQVLCSVEIGPAHTSTCGIAIATQVKRWPQKVGELLASMYLFGTLNYLNTLTIIPQRIMWEIYGVFIMRGTGCILLKMTLSDTDCRVCLLFEGGILSLGAVLEYVINVIGN